MFTCVVHFGGDFILSQRMKYTSKSTAHFDFVYASRFSTFSLCDMVEKLAKEEEEVEYHAFEEGENNVVVEEETNVATEEENSVDVEAETNVAEEEEFDADKEEENNDDEEDEFAADEEDEYVDEFDVNKAYRQEDDIGIRVQRNMDGFGPDGVHANDKDHGLESDSDYSKNLYNEHGSDSDMPRYPEFNSETDLVKQKFVKGLVFINNTSLKEAIKQYGRVDRVEVKLKKNDNRRLQALCKEGYHSWQIKTIVNCHTCPKFWSTYAGAYKYQVEVGPSHQHVVDLVERSCSLLKIMFM
ncbi:hypothetical protein GQ457_06G013470 [Hibiscus cannabinus]